MKILASATYRTVFTRRAFEARILGTLAFAADALTEIIAQRLTYAPDTAENHRQNHQTTAN